MDEILKNDKDKEEFSHELQLVVRDSVRKYFQSLSGEGGITSRSDESPCSVTMAGPKLSLPWKLQLRNNWESKEELVSLTSLAPRANRLEMELPVMVPIPPSHQWGQLL